MSDKEKRGEKYVCHQPYHRSDRFNSFMGKHDERNVKKDSSYTWFTREVGSLVQKTIPENAKLWMFKGRLNKDNSDGESVVVSVPNPNTATVEREEDSDSEYLFSSDWHYYYSAFVLHFIFVKISPPNWQSSK